MSDDKYDLKSMFENGRARVLPLSGRVCPRCGYEARVAPDGELSDSAIFQRGTPPNLRRISPPYHVSCMQEVLLQRDMSYVDTHLGTWIPKEEYHAPGTYVELDEQGKEAKSARSSDAPRDQPESH